jgi:cyclic-di-AMP phosphodiesterase PgpH
MSCGILSSRKSYRLMKQKISKKFLASIGNYREKSRGERTRIVTLGAVFLFHFVLISVAPQFSAIFSRLKISDYTLGSPAPRDLFADRDITYIDEQATILRENAVAGLVSPVLTINEELTTRSLQKFTDFSTLFAEARTKSSSAEKVFLEIQAAQPGLFAQTQISAILEAGNVLPNLNESRIMLDTILSRGVVESLEGKTSPATDTFEVIRQIDGNTTRMIVPIKSIVEAENIQAVVQDILSDAGVDSANRDVIAGIVAVFAEENAFYDAELTRKRREEAIEEVNPVVGNLIKGERIAREGQIIVEDDLKKISALAEYSATVNISRLVGSALLIVLLYILAFIMLSPPISDKRLSDSNLYLLAGISVLYTVMAVVLTRIDGLNVDVPVSVFFPTAFVAMVVTILINPRISIVFGLLLSLLLLPLTNMDPFPVLFAFFTGIAGTMVVSGAQKRLDLIRATFTLALINSLIMAILSVLKNLDLSTMLVAFGWGFVNGFVCGILNVGLLPFLEHLLNAATPFQLIELSDLNSPILKRMLTLAPGTYGHSVAVANLAESACREIGANPLLARVGAYYHDIGKIDQANYFVENQTDENKHNELKPSLSVAVIKSHVKIGLEKGKELGLPLEVLQIIGQHHGSGLISYFYSQAVKSKGNGSVAPEDYSYSGTPPVSKEAAVVMLADGVEAASRTLARPSVAKLEKFIWKSIQDKFASQQMNNCELTFRDLQKIKDSFLHILAGTFHSRIEYPDLDEDQTEGEKQKQEKP